MFILLFMQNIEPIFKHRTIKPCCCLKLQRVTSKKFASAVPWEQKLAVQQTDICSACFPLKIELIKPMWGKWQHPFPGIGRLATLLTTSRAITAPPPPSLPLSLQAHVKPCILSSTPRHVGGVISGTQRDRYSFAVLQHNVFPDILRYLSQQGWAVQSKLGPRIHLNDWVSNTRPFQASIFSN